MEAARGEHADRTAAPHLQIPLVHISCTPGAVYLLLTTLATSPAIKSHGHGRQVQGQRGSGAGQFALIGYPSMQPTLCTLAKITMPSAHGSMRAPARCMWLWFSPPTCREMPRSIASLESCHTRFRSPTRTRRMTDAAVTACRSRAPQIDSAD